ncbi:MAG: histone family protein [Nanoarchaeota archaeon]
MPKQTSTIPKAPLARILMNAGAKRVSVDALEAFSEILETKTTEIASQAAKISKHSGRKTVQSGDVTLAAKR